MLSRSLLSSLPTSSVSMTTGSVKESKKETVGSDTEEQKSTPRKFSEFFQALSEIFVIQGETEPLYIKKIRPFLLTNEVSSLGLAKVEKKSGKKGKNRKKKSVDKALIYTTSNPPPATMNFVKSNKPYYFSQDIAEGNLFTSSTTIPTFSGTYFVFSFLDQSANLVAIFDQYIIDELEYWIEPLPGANAGAGGFLYSVIDYDDANNLTSVQQAADYTNCMMSAATEGHYRRFKPHIAVASYSGTFTSFTNEEAQWIDAASTNVQHYGIKTACTTTTASILYTVRVRIHFRMRNVR